jgi:hypothetical protein
VYVAPRRWLAAFLSMSAMSCVCDEGATDTRCCCASGWGAVRADRDESIHALHAKARARMLMLAQGCKSSRLLLTRV